MALYGIDVSTYQEVGVQGQDFTIIRATFGCPDPGESASQYVDPKCDGHYQLAKQQGKLRGVYHYAYPQYNSALDEANFFVDNIQGYINDAILVLDWEGPDTGNVAWAKAWLDQVYARTGVRPLIYMSASVTVANDWSSVAADYALWCAGYPAAFNVSNPPPPAPDGSEMPYATGAFPFATIWQYSSSAGTLDRDIAYMSADAWNKFATGDRNVPAPTPTPTPQPAPAPTTTNPVPAPSSNQTLAPVPVTKPKVIVPEPTYYKIWDLVVAIFKKLFGKK